MSTATVTGERSRGHFVGARMLGGRRASSAALSDTQSDTGLPVCVKLTLISASSGARCRYLGHCENTPMPSANRPYSRN